MAGKSSDRIVYSYDYFILYFNMSILDILDSVQTEYRRISNAAEMSVSGEHQMITARASPFLRMTIQPSRCGEVAL